MVRDLHQVDEDVGEQRVSRHNREGARLSGARAGRGEDKAGELERLLGLRLADRTRDLPTEGVQSIKYKV